MIEFKSLFLGLQLRMPSGGRAGEQGPGEGGQRPGEETRGSRPCRGLWDPRSQTTSPSHEPGLSCGLWGSCPVLHPVQAPRPRSAHHCASDLSVGCVDGPQTWPRPNMLSRGVFRDPQSDGHAGRPRPAQPGGGPAKRGTEEAPQRRAGVLGSWHQLLVQGPRHLKKTASHGAQGQWGSF